MTKLITAVAVLFMFAMSGFAQTSSPSTDVFVMFGSDHSHGATSPKANYNVGVGQTETFLKKSPVGDEITFGYTYENAGPGFLHSNFGSHTEALGLMKNFSLPKTKCVTGYTWLQDGITTFTGGKKLENRFYNGESLGAIVHLKNNNSIWIQETYNKVVSTPWYLTSSIGFTKSF